MVRLTIELPFFIPLAEGDYSLRIQDEIFTIRHKTIRQSSLDQRLGGISGSFGFEKDQLGLVQFSQLEAEAPIEQLLSVGRDCGAEPNNRRPQQLETAVQTCALNLFNCFLEKYRVSTRDTDVRPVRAWDLAHLTVEDSRSKSEIRLYGGGVGLAKIGLARHAEGPFLEALAIPDGPAEYVNGALGAWQAALEEQPNDALIQAAEALEAAADFYLTRVWRGQTHATKPKDAARELKLDQTRDVFSIEDVLEQAGIRRKLQSPRIRILANWAGEIENVLDAIEVRNLAVHGGIQIPPAIAPRHVQTIVSFVLDALAPEILRTSFSTRHELLVSYEEAMGSPVPDELRPIIERYLVGPGIAAKLLNRKHKSHADQICSERFGNTLVIRIAFADFGRDDVNLFIARSLMHHWLQRQSAPFAHVSRSLPDEATRAYWQLVASEMTRQVWGAAIDRHASHLGLGSLVTKKNSADGASYLAKYRCPYTVPATDQLGYWVEYLELARLAAALPEDDKNKLMAAAAMASPETARRAQRAIPAMENADFEDFGSILASLVSAHDAHESILASVPIYDPTSNKEFGLGLNLSDLGKLVSLQ